MTKTLIVAELSANHNGSKRLAIETVRAVAQTGADAIKLQTYTAETLTLASHKEDFRISQGTCGMDGIYMICIRKHIHLGNGMRNCSG